MNDQRTMADSKVAASNDRHSARAVGLTLGAVFLTMYALAAIAMH